MRLLYLYRYGILGGVTTQLSNRLQFLKPHAEPHFGFLEEHGGRTTFGDYPHTYTLPDRKALVDLLQKIRFDVVLPIDTPEVYAGIRAGGFQGLIINEVHTTTRNLQYLREVREERIDAFLAPSAYLVERIQEEFRYRGRVPCYLTQNCLDTSLFSFRPPPQTPSRKILLWVGKLDDHKNWRAFLRLAREARKRGNDCEFWLIGGETARDQVVEEMFDLAGDYELLSRLKWIPRVEYSRMPLIYSLVAASGGVAVSTSTDESFGMTVAESLSCLCPVVAPDVGAIPEILNGELESSLYPSNDMEAALSKLMELMDDQNQRMRLVEKGRQKVAASYGIQPAGQRYLHVLNEIQTEGKTHSQDG